ncbi:cupin-like domain-containing protein [Nostoc sp. UHCC 0702]|nr:cupin-like domain-containing protein [Nostoc sp. UHCC 0702]
MNIAVENKLAQTSVKKIERIHKPTLEEFKQATHSYSQPVIITGKIAEWKAFSLWSIDYLNTVLSKKEINVSVSQTQRFAFEPENDYVLPTTKMQFTEFTDWILQSNKADQYYYLNQNPIETSFPELLPDIETPEYFNKKLFLVANLWIGTGGNTIPLHWDSAQNLLCQVRGRKRFLLFEPKQTPFLYPFPVDSKISHMSPVNIEKPDLDKFPKFQKAKYIEDILEPDEMLYIPPFWWHQFYSLDQLNISVNFWWMANLKDYFAPQSRRIFLKNPKQLWDFLNYFAKQMFERNKV